MQNLKLKLGNILEKLWLCVVQKACRLFLYWSNLMSALIESKSILPVKVKVGLCC